MVENVGGVTATIECNVLWAIEIQFLTRVDSSGHDHWFYLFLKYFLEHFTKVMIGQRPC